MYQKESFYKVAKCIFHHVCVTRKVLVKLEIVYIITCGSQLRNVVIKFRSAYIIRCVSQLRTAVLKLGSV